MCELRFFENKSSLREEFNLKFELSKVFPKEKVDRIINEIKTFPTFRFPCKAKPACLAVAGPSTRFNENGELVGYDAIDALSSYLVTFERRYVREKLEVRETLYYNFN